MMLRSALNADEVAKKVEKKSSTKFEPMGLNPLKKSIFPALLANFTKQAVQKWPAISFGNLCWDEQWKLSQSTQVRVVYVQIN